MSCLSKFYKKYPSCTTDPALYQEHAGYFQDLEAYCGMSLKRKNIDAILDEGEDGLFDWMLHKSVFRNLIAMYRKEEKIRLRFYLFEHVFELMMLEHDIVSESPSFGHFIMALKAKT